VLWPKERILEVYLNVAEFGHGVMASAREPRVFRMSPPRLNSLSGGAPRRRAANPSAWRADAPSNYVLRRRDWIADRWRARRSRVPRELRNPHSRELALIKKRRRGKTEKRK